MNDELKDIEYFQHQLTHSMAVPMNTIVDSFQKLSATTITSMQAIENMGRVMKKLSLAQDEMMRRILGIPPRSAIDRLADLADDV